MMPQPFNPRAWTTRLRWWLIRKLMRPQFSELLGSKIGPKNVGELMILHRPPSTENLSHDARYALHCGQYTFLFYAPVEEWRPTPPRPRVGINPGNWT